MDRPTQKSNQEPHSGNPNLPDSLRERPVETFDMSLKEANDAGKITTWPPVGAPEPTYTIPKPENEPSKKRKKLPWIIGSGVLATVIAGGAWFVVNAQNQPPVSEPVPTKPAEPFPTTEPSPEPQPTSGEEEPGEEVPNPVPSGENDPVITPENQAAMLESLQLSAELSPSELGVKTTEVMSRWLMAGATFDTYNNQDFSITPEEYAAKLAAQNADTYKEALFGENADANTDESITSFISGAESANAKNIERFLQTYSDAEHPNSNTANEETFYSRIVSTPEDVIAVGNTDGDELTLVIKQSFENNGEKTMFGEIPESTMELRIFYVKEGDSYVINTFTAERQ